MKRREKLWNKVRRKIMADSMKGVSFPHHRRGKYSSLQEMIRNRVRLVFVLTGIVQYNSRFRNYLRDYGVNSLIKELIREVPELKQETLALDYLRKWTAANKLADYDIQCYHIKDKVTILGHTFDGLEDIRLHCAMVANEFCGKLECRKRENVTEYPDIHIGRIYENYPVFDSYDLSDDRTYSNYIFRSSPITEMDMVNTFRTSHGFNFCMVHEDIRPECLPILYYSGDGEYMLLAAKRASRLQTINS